MDGQTECLHFGDQLSLLEKGKTVLETDRKVCAHMCVHVCMHVHAFDTNQHSGFPLR